MKKDAYKRKFALDYFRHKIKKCNLFESAYFLLHNRTPGITKLFYPDSFYLQEHNFINDTVNYNLDRNKKYFTEGHWQSHRYLLNFENVLRQDLEFDILITDEMKKQTETIESCESVSIHFRRKEYSRLIDLSFYYDAISMIRTKTADPMFFIFTDEPVWVKNNFVYNAKDTIFINRRNEIYDFYLMTKCRHHIISNSTFAWWASWLSKTINKIIVAPTSTKWPDNNVLYPGLITP